MIAITVKFPIKPEHADDFPRLARGLVEGTRAEPGCRWFEMSRSIDDPNVYVVIEAFDDAEAGAAHVQSAHFVQAQRDLPPYLSRTPEVLYIDSPETDGWAELGEFRVE